MRTECLGNIWTEEGGAVEMFLIRRFKSVLFTDLEVVDVDERVVLKWIFKKLGWDCRVDLSGSG